MKKSTLSVLFLLMFFCNHCAFAQYTEVINSNKPGFSESPYSVGKGVYQFESNLFYRNVNTQNLFSVPKSMGLDLFFRTSFFLERLELNAQMAYQKDEIFSINPAVRENLSGFGKFTVGAKFLIYEQTYEDKSKEVRSWVRRNAFDMKRLIPSVAVYVGMNKDFVTKTYQTGNISPKFGILLQNDFTNNFNLITNFFYDNYGTNFEEFSYIITATQNFYGRWSGFLENQTIYHQNFTEINLGGGLAFLYSKNLQINSSVRFLSEANSNGFYGSLGVSYRIDNHKDSFVEIGENGKEIKDTPISRYNKKQNSFFRRIFGSSKRRRN